MAKKVVIVAHELLRAHERTRKKRLESLVAEIKQDGYIWNPVLVDKNTMIILDGHHRCAALKQLGIPRVPVRFVDYTNKDIRVTSWRTGERVTKKTVVDAGLSGKLLRIKTSRHVYAKKPFVVRVLLKDLK